MSWLFGLVGPAFSKEDFQNAHQICGTPLYTFSKDGEYHIVTGGNNKTCFATKGNIEASPFWIGLGCPIKQYNHRSKIYSHDDWENISNGIISLDNSDGHYVYLLYKNNDFKFRTDTLGLRTLYWYETNGKIVFSTRMDWITKFLHGRQINYENIGSRWLIFNQLSYKSLVNDIHRLGPGGELFISNNTVLSKECPFLPDPTKEFSHKDTVSLINNLVFPQIDDRLSITLGLSGGLDSRVLLSLLLKGDHGSFRTHTFGNIKDPDVFIPKSMGIKEHFSNTSYDNPLPPAHEVITLLNNYVSETNLVEPISTVLRLRNYVNIDAAKFIMIDGGFGEIARRQYLNRLAIKGKKHFSDKNIDVIFDNLRYKRANIFTAEVQQRMETGVRNEIQYMFDTMPDINDIGFENYLDLWAVRTRFPNFGADEQARLDSFILNYMPFAQPSFINTVFGMPVSLRNNGRFFRNIIRENYPVLTKYPLVKNGVTYPFYLSTKTSWLYAKIKSKLGYGYSVNNIHTFLGMMKDYIFDILLSQNTRENPTYNYQKIHSMVESYYSGDKSYSQEINWWLTFELWRKNIELK